MEFYHAYLLINWLWCITLCISLHTNRPISNALKVNIQIILSANYNPRCKAGVITLSQVLDIEIIVMCALITTIIMQYIRVILWLQYLVYLIFKCIL